MVANGPRPGRRFGVDRLHIGFILGRGFRVYGHIGVILGLCRDNGKENGNYFLWFEV